MDELNKTAVQLERFEYMQTPISRLISHNEARMDCQIVEQFQVTLQKLGSQTAHTPSRQTVLRVDLKTYRFMPRMDHH